MSLQCYTRNPEEVHDPVVVVMTVQPSGNRVPLCKPCLDGWLDLADDEDCFEPTHLQWVVPVAQLIGRLETQ